MHHINRSICCCKGYVFQPPCGVQDASLDSCTKFPWRTHVSTAVWRAGCIVKGSCNIDSHRWFQPPCGVQDASLKGDDKAYSDKPFQPPCGVQDASDSILELIDKWKVSTAVWRAGCILQTMQFPLIWLRFQPPCGVQDASEVKAVYSLDDFRRFNRRVACRMHLFEFDDEIEEVEEVSTAVWRAGCILVAGRAYLSSSGFNRRVACRMHLMTTYEFKMDKLSFQPPCGVQDASQ